MKIVKNIKQNYQLLSLKLIQSEIYKKKHYLKNISLEDIEFRLKKAFYIIYLYHILNKKILFVGTPLNIGNKIKTIVKNIKHVFIPKGIWIAGTITNKKIPVRFLTKRNNKKSHLMIVVDKELITNSALKESYRYKLPSIGLNSDLNPFDIKLDYKVPGNIITPINLNDNFFYSILFSIFKKEIDIRKKFQNISTSQRLRVVSIMTFRDLKKKMYSRKNRSHSLKKDDINIPFKENVKGKFYQNNSLDKVINVVPNSKKKTNVK